MAVNLFRLQWAHHWIGIASVCLSVSPSAWAQNELPTITVTSGASARPVDLGGFGETPISELPMQAVVWSDERLADSGLQDASELTKADASVTEAYNAVGYIDYVSVRGYTLDNRFNYLRDGLPINAETSLSLFNKQSVELLKGISGMQLGTSAPGGAVNFIVKRPTVNIRSAKLEWRSNATRRASVDISQRFGTNDVFGLRLNALTENKNPPLRDANGQERALAMAFDWALGPDTVLETDWESSHQSQKSQPGLSLLGARLPDARTIDPRTNLNNQAWSLPVVFDNVYYSIRLQHQLDSAWQVQAHWGKQTLKTDDRVAFPYGCGAEGAYDRFCSNGEFDLYDYRSENERRNTDNLKLSIRGQVKLGQVHHQLVAGTLAGHFVSRFQPMAYNSVGLGNISANLQTTPDASTYDGNTNLGTSSREWFIRDAMQLGKRWRLWTGLRHTRLQRDSALTDGTQALQYTQAFTTPWAALSYKLRPQHTVYASWGTGVESIAVPRLPLYSNAGQILPALKSQQVEVGLKGQTGNLGWSMNAFDIQRPQYSDMGNCDVDGSCVRRMDGNQEHQGIEAGATMKWTGGAIQVSAMHLQAKRTKSADASLNGLEPVNVPRTSMRLHAQQSLPSVPGLTLAADWTHESGRVILPDNSMSIPGWSRLDVSARLTQTTSRGRLTWRLGIENLMDARAWKEAPYQYGHVYLFPMAPRMFRFGLEWQFQ